MKTVTIDLSCVRSRDDLHRAFQQALPFPEWYRYNLDALHDCLTSLPEPTALKLTGWDAVRETLGNYAVAARRAIDAAVAEYSGLTVTYLP